MIQKLAFILLLALMLLLAGCQSGQPAVSKTPGTLKVLAVETFLEDMAQNVAGDRLKLDSLVPTGVDPHSFEPVPQDVSRIADCQVLIINGAGLESWLQKVLDNAGGVRQVVTASAGLKSRTPGAGEVVDADINGDPHFWLDPNNAIHYVENIRDGLVQADPAGKEIYTRNAQAYIAKLVDLDAWIKAQVVQVPQERRLLVTNHESLGYFADRYGFSVVGAIIPSVTTGSSPSAQQLAGLVERIKASKAPAIFLETGVNPDMARQIAAETGVTVVTGLYTHSTTPPGGEAPDYISIIKFDTQAIVNALK
jgi:ABC-type Zn uptake system ZnuABC Zn-binding protein ZnuA